jgi:DNA-binding NarL/FixJ family response regulator
MSIDSFPRGSMIRVSVQSASPFARAGLEQALMTDPRLEIIRPEETDDSADVVLVDGSTGDVARLRSTSIETGAPRIVLLIDALDPADLPRLLSLGVRGVLPRDSNPFEIAAALETAMQDLVVTTVELLEAVLPADHREAQPDDLQESLTSRELEVLALLAEGAGNKEIAAKLNISDNTAKFHVSSILGKLGTATRTEAVTRGYRLGLILI